MENADQSVGLNVCKVCSLVSVMIMKDEEGEEGGQVAGLGEDYSEYEDYEIMEGFEATLHTSSGVNLDNRGNTSGQYCPHSAHRKADGLV